MRRLMGNRWGQLLLGIGFAFLATLIAFRLVIIAFITIIMLIAGATVGGWSTQLDSLRASIKQAMDQGWHYTEMYPFLYYAVILASTIWLMAPLRRMRWAQLFQAGLILLLFGIMMIWSTLAGETSAGAVFSLLILWACGALVTWAVCLFFARMERFSSDRSGTESP